MTSGQKEQPIPVPETKTTATTPNSAPSVQFHIDPDLHQQQLEHTHVPSIHQPKPAFNGDHTASAMIRNPSSSSLRSQASSAPSHKSNKSNNVISRFFKKSGSTNSINSSYHHDPSKSANDKAIDGTTAPGLSLTPNTSTSQLTPKVSNTSEYSTTESTDSNNTRSGSPKTRLRLKRFFKPGATSTSSPNSSNSLNAAGKKLKEQHDELHKVINTKLNKLMITGHGHSSSSTSLSSRFGLHKNKEAAKKQHSSAPHTPAPQTPPKAVGPGGLPSSKSPEDLESDKVMESLVSSYGVIPDKSTEKYLLGEGAGGSVLIVKRPSDNHIFAIKKFRPQNIRETDFDYRKKVHNEYNLLADLKHENIVRVYELLHESSLYVLVMQYCPYDFFTIVMGGVMSKLEIYCYFKQMVKGVLYLHEQGIAHRDLKLDNCVLTKQGILKLIDFGSAVVFKPKTLRTDAGGSPDLESESLLTLTSNGSAASTTATNASSIIKAKGIVGSDPYLAPECLGMATYDPRPVDVWSMAIMFCCMVLRRFPWKIPKTSDPSYKAFSADPSEHVDENGRKKIMGPNRLLRLLPSSSRELIGKMLTIKPENRSDMSNVLSSEFISGINSCRLEIGGDDEETFIKSDDHTHHLITEEDLKRIELERQKQKEVSSMMT